jgi:hypothetical protein
MTIINPKDERIINKESIDFAELDASPLSTRCSMLNTN